MEDLIIIGAGGSSQQIAEAIEGINLREPRWNLLGFLDDDPAKLGQTIGGARVLGPVATAKQYAARFVIGGLSRKDPLNPLILRSGDVLVMGGPSRLRYHGVTRIQPGTAPEGTGPGRINLTFRQW